MSKKSNGKKELIIGGVVAGLMMGGTAMASLKGAEANGDFFKIRELRSGYQLAAAEKTDTTKVTEEKACQDKACKDKSCKGKADEKKAEPGKTTDAKAKDEKHCCDKSCGDKAKDKSSGDSAKKKDMSGDHGCGEKSCG